MAKLYKYKKVIDKYTTHTLLEADAQENKITELCTLDGVTYVSVPDDVALMAQAKKIDKTLSPVVLSGVLEEAIKAASPHTRLINSRVVDRIRLKYSISDEIMLLRLRPCPEFDEYNSYVEECVAWGSGEKEKILGKTTIIK